MSWRKATSLPGARGTWISEKSAVLVRRGSTVIIRVLGSKCSPFANHLEKHGMIDRHIRANNQKNIRMLNIVITGRRSVRTERLHVTHHSRRHAESAIGIYVIRSGEIL